MHARTLPVNSLVQGVWRQAASLVPRYRDRGAGRPPDRLPKRSCQVAEPRRLPGTRPPNPAAVTMVTYPSCHCRTNKKRPGSSKSSPPSLHCAPGGRHRHSAQTYYSTKFVLSDSIFPLSKGGDDVIFFLATGGTYPSKVQHLSPIKRGGCCHFFFCPVWALFRRRCSTPPNDRGECCHFFLPRLGLNPS